MKRSTLGKPHTAWTLTALSSALMLCAPHAFSQAASFGKHVHGEAELTIAMEGQHLELYLRSPADNILGFEHEPQTDSQRQQVYSAIHTLEDPNHLFVFTGANCTATNIQVDNPFGDLAESDHEEHDHEEHDHEEHDHEEHDHEEHDHEEHDHEDASDHAEFSALFQFQCNGEITGIDVTLLDTFTGITTLHTQWINDSGQGAAELSSASKHIDWR